MENNFLEDFLSKRELKRLNKIAKSQRIVVQTKSLKGTQEITECSGRQPKKLSPKTTHQAELLDALKKFQLITCVGPAGTGKTFLTVTYAANLLLERKIDKLILTRPNVHVGKTIGLLPGDSDEKLAPLLGPSTAVLKSVLGNSLFEYMVKKGQIVMQPLEYVRGLSWGSDEENVFVFIDEAQNLETEETKALTTRIGTNCQMVFSGDTTQSDLKHCNGLTILKNTIKTNKEIAEYSTVIEFDLDDIVRSGLCKAFVRHYYLTGI